MERREMAVHAPVPRRLETIRAHKERGGAVAAILPIHYPRALLRAFGVLPVEVWGPPRVDQSRGAAHLQPYVCSIVRSALSFLMEGALDVADLIIVPHACDSLQGLGSLLLDFVKPRQPVLPLYLPRGRRESDIDFLAEEFRSLYKSLESIIGPSPSDKELLESSRREEEADRLLAELYRRRASLPLNGLEFYRFVRAREFLPAERFTELARSALAQPAAEPRDGIPILLSGIVPEPPESLEVIDEMGGIVVADDLACCGRRRYPLGESEDPFRRLAERLIAAPPDPTRGSPLEERLAYMLEQIETFGATGVVFYEPKFCEPELFDLPQLRRGLGEAGIPSIVIEVDINDPLSYQVHTRLEAFLEVVG
ncbi:MAG: 2-hydroxyacyl-CoA dehydratase subunit D [Candidatus Bipolaricaulia bacterium]